MNSAFADLDRLMAGGASQTETVRASMAIALGLVCLPGLSFAIGQLYLLAGGRISTAPAVLILSIAVGMSLLLAWRLSRTWVAPAAVVAIAVAAAAACAVVYDTSYDGQQYHFDAVVSLAQGWNPYRDGAPSPDYAAAINSMPIWVEHYPQGSWLPSALLHAAGLPPEAAKVQAALAMAALFFGVLGLVRSYGVGLIKSLALAGLAAANPILLAQLFSRMNDGLMIASLALLLVFASVWVLERQRWAMIGVIMAIIVALNLKFSAILFVVFFSAMVCVFALWMRGLQRAMLVGGVLAAAGLASLLIFGAHPYVTNLIGHGHPLFPLGGEGALDIMAQGGNVPPAFESLNAIERLGASYFGATSSGYWGADPHLKIPLMIESDELMAGAYDTRIAGFGPWFSAALIMSVLLAVLLLIQTRRSTTTMVLLATAAGFFVLGLLLPEPWWARYVPQVWLSPVLVAAAALLADVRWVRVAGWVLAGILAVNVGLVALSSAKYVGRRNVNIYEQLADMRNQPGPICMYVSSMHSRVALPADLKDKVRVQNTPLEGCTVTPLAEDAQPTDLAGYCPCN